MKAFLIISLFITTLFGENLRYDLIKELLKEKFLQTYPDMTIEDISIKSSSPLIKKFSDYAVDGINITKDNLRRKSANIQVTLKKGDKKRKFYFRYDIKATIPLYKTVTSVKAGREITPDIVTLKRVAFTTLYGTPLREDDFYRFIAKTNINEDRIIYLRSLKKLTDIKRNDIVRAVIKDGALSLSFSAKALGEGNIGDIIKIKKDHKKIFKAKIVSKTEVEIIN